MNEIKKKVTKIHADNISYLFWFIKNSTNKNLIKIYEIEKKIRKKILITCFSFLFIFIFCYLLIYEKTRKKERQRKILALLSFEKEIHLLIKNYML